ncbi:MAG: Maf family nucleotide pyrophosphatase [Chloroflexota bacterium]
MRFILASSSPRRRAIISEMIDDFEIIKPDIDETQHDSEAPLAYVKRLSLEKAQAVAEQVLADDATILAADTVVILAADTIGIEENGEILGKPIDADDTKAMLTRLRNRPHFVCTAFTLMRGRYHVTEVVSTKVHMRYYSDAEIDAYIATGDPFDKAGSYAIQHEGFHPVREIEGSYSNVVGLPTDEVRQELIRAGVPIKNSPYRVNFHEHLIEEFIPSETPFPPKLDPSVPMVFAICILKMGDQFLLHYNPERQQWEHAGGGIEAGEHPDETAIREVWEETSQRIENPQCLGVIKFNFVRDTKIEYAPLYVAEITEVTTFTPNNESSKLILWDEATSLEEPISQVSYGVLKFL